MASAVAVLTSRGNVGRRVEAAVTLSLEVFRGASQGARCLMQVSWQTKVLGTAGPHEHTTVVTPMLLSVKSSIAMSEVLGGHCGDSKWLEGPRASFTPHAGAGALCLTAMLAIIGTAGAVT
jgi:hypothetical protein